VGDEASRCGAVQQLYHVIRDGQWREWSESGVHLDMATTI